MSITYFGAFSDTADKKVAFGDCNYGDLAILKSEKQLFGEGDVITPRDKGSKEVQTDVLIIGGGGLVHPTGSNTGWLVNIEGKDIKALARKGCKIIVMAVGINFSSEKEQWPEKAKLHLKCLCERAAYVCGRDFETVKFLAFHGAESHLCPDPALFLFGKDEIHRNMESKFFNVVWHPDVENEMIGEIARMTGLIPRFMLQNEIFRQSKKWEEVKKGFKCLPTASVDDYINNLKGANFTVSSSLHGMILSIGMGIPVVNIHNSQRMRNFRALFLNHYDGFPCILDKSELEYVDTLAKIEHPGIPVRRQALRNIFDSNVAEIKKVIRP